MSREDGNKTSLCFATQKDIEKRQEENTLTISLKRGAEKVITKLKDLFHKNEDFYAFDQTKENR
ncbi:MAG: hypothetical protein BGO67_03640 [Alphaproteobacteria bacterium 41-28]|nr:MAG: hypothetical protein BGO67_03640 [Alphaproteobacteria bacterium 41-28]